MKKDSFTYKKSNDKTFWIVESSSGRELTFWKSKKEALARIEVLKNNYK